MKSTYTGPATVFRHDKNGHTFYSVAVSKKNSRGETEFGYKLVQFKKGVDIADRAKIEIKNAWETFYTSKDGETVFYVFISDFVLQRGNAAGYPPNSQPYGYQAQGYQSQDQGYQGGQEQPPRGRSAKYKPEQQMGEFDQINEEVPF